MKLRSANQSSSSSDVNKSGHYLEKISILEREIERLKIIERSHKECDHTIEKLKMQISILEKKLRGLKESRTLGSP